MFEPTKEVTPGDAPSTTLPDPTSSNTPDATPAQGDASSDAGTPDADLNALADGAATVYAGFNPDIHRTGPDGKPIMTPTGRFAKKARGASNAAFVSRPMSAPSQGVAGVKIDNLPIAKQITNIGINLAVRVFGTEWEPKEKSEAEAVAFAFRDYFDARGVPQMPPEVILILAIGAYSLPRLNHENTKTKLHRMFLKVRDWRNSFKGNKK